MKTAIIYSSRYGTTETCAQMIQGQVENAHLINTDKATPSDLASYDQVIIGSSVYIGQLRKPIRKLLDQSKDLLLKKKLHFFFCCNEETDYKALLPEDLRECALSINHMGYELKTDKMGFFHRMIIKKVAGTTQAISHIKHDQLNQVCENFS